MLLAELRLAQWFVDFATILGVIGTMATIVALGFTLWQVRETKKAAEAARDAAIVTAEADRLEFTRFMVASCHRLLRETIMYVDDGQYELGALRASDLAELLVQIRRNSTNSDSDQDNEIAGLRALDETLKSLSRTNRKLSSGSLKKWQDLRRRIYAIIDPLHGPFVQKT